MPLDQAATFYLPAQRESIEKLERIADSIAATDAPALYDGYPVFTLILNNARQIVYANDAALALMGDCGPASLRTVLGQRPGEALGCSHAKEGPGGCGTAPFCRLCGAARSLEGSLMGSSVVDEYLIERERGGGVESLDLMAWSKPICLAGHDLILLSARDISDQKRREVLERLFKHDIANTATGIRNLVEMMHVMPPDARDRCLDLLRSAADRLAEEITSHRALMEAEAGTLAVAIEPVDGRRALEETAGFFAFYQGEHGVRIEIEASPDRAIVETDPALLRRILINMEKNALEASKEGQVVALACAKRGEETVFEVRNPEAMAEDTKRRIFVRSFSTKGTGRGVGTYAMRLLAERYLGGRVEFDSMVGAGTVFRLILPNLVLARSQASRH